MREGAVGERRRGRLGVGGLVVGQLREGTKRSMSFYALFSGGIWLRERGCVAKSGAGLQGLNRLWGVFIGAWVGIVGEKVVVGQDFSTDGVNEVDRGVGLDTLVLPAVLRSG